MPLGALFRTRRIVIHCHQTAEGRIIRANASGSARFFDPDYRYGTVNVGDHQSTTQTCFQVNLFFAEQSGELFRPARSLQSYGTPVWAGKWFKVTTVVYFHASNKPPITLCTNPSAHHCGSTIRSHKTKHTHRSSRSYISTMLKPEPIRCGL